MPKPIPPIAIKIAQYIRYNNESEIEEALNSKKIHVDDKLPQYKYLTLLQYAAYYGQLEICQLFIRNGATLDPEDTTSPILLAMQHDHQAVAEFLILCGGNKKIAIEQAEKQAPSLIKAIKNLSPEPYLYLFGCIFKGNEKLTLLLVNINKDCSGWKKQAAQLLCLACRLNFSEAIIRAMLDAGYPTKLEDINDRTCLYWAAVNGMSKKLITDLIANYDVDPILALKHAIVDNKDAAVHHLKDFTGPISQYKFIDSKIESDETLLYHAHQDNSNILTVSYTLDERSSSFLKALRAEQYVAVHSLLKAGVAEWIVMDAIKQKNKQLITTLRPVYGADIYKKMKGMVLNNEINIQECSLSELNELAQSILLFNDKALFDKLNVHPDFYSILVNQLYNAVNYLDIERLTHLEQQVGSNLFLKYIDGIKALAQKNKKSGIINALIINGFIPKDYRYEKKPALLETLPSELLAEIISYAGIQTFPQFLLLSQIMRDTLIDPNAQSSLSLNAQKELSLISRYTLQELKNLNIVQNDGVYSVVHGDTHFDLSNKESPIVLNRHLGDLKKCISQIKQLEELMEELQKNALPVRPNDFFSICARIFKVTVSLSMLLSAILLGATSGILLLIGKEPYNKLLEACEKLVALNPRGDILCGYMNREVLCQSKCWNFEYSPWRISAQAYRDEVSKYWDPSFIMLGVNVILALLFLIYHLLLCWYNSRNAQDYSYSRHLCDLYGVCEIVPNEMQQHLTKKAHTLLNQLNDNEMLVNTANTTDPWGWRGRINHAQTTIEQKTQTIQSNIRFFPPIQSTRPETETEKTAEVVITEVIIESEEHTPLLMGAPSSSSGTGRG